jgi:hypothetical protein
MMAFKMPAGPLEPSRWPKLALSEPLGMVSNVLGDHWMAILHIDGILRSSRRAKDAANGLCLYRIPDCCASA